MRRLKVSSLVQLAGGREPPGSIFARLVLDDKVLKICNGDHRIIIPLRNIVSIEFSGESDGRRMVRIRYVRSGSLGSVKRLVIAGPSSPLERVYSVVKELLNEENKDLPLNEGGKLDREDLRLLYLLYVKREQLSPGILGLLLNVSGDLLGRRLARLRKLKLIDEDMKLTDAGVEAIRRYKLAEARV